MPAQAISELLQRRQDFLGFVRRRVGDPALAEDILQSAYLRAIEAGERSGMPRQPDSIVAWFYRVLRNAVIDHYRHNASRSAALDRWAVALDALDPLSARGPELERLSSRAPHDPETWRAVCRCISAVIPSLKPAYADLLREVDLAEAPLSAFAARHAISPGNAAVRAHRARAALKRELIRTCGACARHACARGQCTCAPPSPSR